MTDTVQVPREATEEACGYAERLAVIIHEKHYSDVPQWRPLTGDLIGLLTQIDNMTAGMTRAAPQATDPRDADRRLLDDAATALKATEERALAAEAEIKRLRDALRKLLDDINVRAEAYRHSPSEHIRRHYENLPISDGVLSEARALATPPSKTETRDDG